MGSGGSGSSGGSSGGGGGGWGPTMGSGGNAYGRGGVGGIGTAGTMSSGAGGSAMGGFGNTGAGGSGMAGISTHSGETPAGFTPAYGDPRGLSLGMNANGTYGGVGLRENGQTVLGYVKSMDPYGQVKYRTVIQRLTPSKTPGFGYNQWGNLVKMNTPLPTETNALRFRMSPTETQVFGDPYNMTGPPPGFPNPQRPGGYNNPGPKGTIGPQVGSSSTFGPGAYGNGGLMSGNPAGGGLSTGLGSRMGGVGVSGGTSRTSGNVIGSSGTGYSGNGMQGYGGGTVAGARGGVGGAGVGRSAEGRTAR